jgi:hypothetical protein
MGGLVRKEFGDQRPFLLLVIVLTLLDLGSALATQFDLQPLALKFFDIGEEFALLMFLVAFAIGTGLLVREIDDRTLVFLDGLPTNRWQVFGAKIAVAMAVLSVYPLGLVGLMSVQHVWSRSSLDYVLHAGLLGASFAMTCIVIAVGLTLGLLLGFLRNLCWLALALGAIVLRLSINEWPALSVLNPVELLDIRLVGVNWRVPTIAIATQLILFFACGLIAMAVFARSGDGRGSRLQMRLSRPLISAVVTFATIAASIGAVMYYASSSETARSESAKGFGAARFELSASGYARTSRYSFKYPAQYAEKAQSLIGKADAAFDQVAEILRTDAGAVVDVDLSGSRANTEGTAFYNRIRMHARGDDALDTLVHETAHVLAFRLAGGERERELSKIEAFNEGLAHWVENSVISGSGLTRIDRLQAAIVSHRHLPGIEHLADMETFALEADRNLQYPLGAVVVDGVVARYGGGALKTLLDALAQPDFPRDLRGFELWLAAFQAAGFDLALVFDDCARRVEEWEKEFATEIASLPRPRGSLVRDVDYIGVELRLDGEVPASWTPTVRFRPQEDSGVQDYVTEYVDEDNVAWLSLDNVANEQVCFQPGMQVIEVTIFEPWVCLPLDSAVEIDN